MDRMTPEEIEVRVWAWIVAVLAAIVFISAVGILLGVLFVEHDMERISPIDTTLLAMQKDIMMLCIGAIAGVASRKGAAAIADKLGTKPEEPKGDDHVG
jgi:hypothetical protein